METLRILLAVFVPWTLGVAVVAWRWRDRPAGSRAVIAGYGFLIGMLVVTLLMRLAEPLGMLTAFWPVLIACAALAALVIAGGAHPFRRPGGGTPWAVAELPRIEKLLLCILFALVATRLVTLGIEVLLRPTYPWDAISSWTYKARAFFEIGVFVSIEGPGAMSRDPAGAGVVYSAAGSTYPLAIPLIQIWMASAAGQWNDVVINLPWLFCTLAVALALYGQMRIAGAGMTVALATVWLLVSLPMLDTHTALAGYADLWVAVSLGAAAFAFFNWMRTGDRRQGVLALVAALFMAGLKEPASLWLAGFAAGLLAFKLPGRWLLGLIGATVLLMAALILAGGVTIPIPGIEPFRLLPMQPLLGTQIAHLFLLDNWHLLGVVMPIAMAAAVPLAVRDRALRGLLVLSAFNLFAYYLVFFHTQLADMLRIGTLNNRILLQIAPVLVFLTGLVAMAWLPGRASAGTAAPVSEENGQA